MIWRAQHDRVDVPIPPDAFQTIIERSSFSLEGIGFAAADEEDLDDDEDKDDDEDDPADDDDASSDDD